MNKLCVFQLILVALLCAGCSTSRIRASDGGDHAIYVDDVYKADGEAFIGQTGPDHTAIIEARDGDRIVGSIAVQRQMGVGSVVLGFFTYFTSLYWYRHYPDEIVIPIKPTSLPQDSVKTQTWDKPLSGPSAWEKPMK